MPTVRLPTYDVLIERGSLDAVGAQARAAAPSHRTAVITDRTVASLYGDRVTRGLRDPVVHLEIPPGERHKTRATWSDLTDRLLAAGCGRDTTLIALGGGVIGDLAGFVAATFLRGVPYVHVPTTLLAMVDASIGGKTGVDTPAGKNLVGAFHQPAAVIADPETLATLPLEQLRAGMAEVIKHGAIADEAYFDRVVSGLPAMLRAEADETSRQTLTEVIARSVEIKAAIVRSDEREQGLRKVLNFGHTLGHALELASGFALSHGEAVAIGMRLETCLAERLGIAEPGTADRVAFALAAAGLPAARPPDLSPQQILRATWGDKKARAGAVHYALPARIGAMAGAAQGWAIPVEDRLVAEVLG